MSETAKQRIVLGPRATDLAAELTGEVSWQGLEAGIRKLQEDRAAAGDQPISPHLGAIYEALATLQLMLLALTAKEDSRITEAVERMSIRCEKLLQKATDFAEVKGPKLNLLSDRLRADQQINERGIEQSERTPVREGQER